MSMDFTSSDKPSSDLDNESPMFAATPIWERSGKKKRGFGRSSTPAARTTDTVAATPLAAEPVVTHEPMLGTTVDPVMGSTTRVDPMVAPAVETEPMTAAPYTRTTTTVRKKDGIPAVAIAAGVIALGGLAAAGWYASQPRDTGVAQLTPGAPGENALASATAPAGATTTTTTTMAANTPPPAPTTTVRRSTTTTTRMAAAAPRVRPAAAVAPSAGDVGVNTSATLPVGPQPYAGATTPNPSATPAPMPSTPAVEPDPAPSASSPTTTTPATPAPEASTAPTTTPQ